MSRHRWYHPREHVYICVKCGTGKVNRLEGGRWLTTFHLPNGKSIETPVTPPCEEGPLTAQYIGKYANEIVKIPELMK